MTGVIAFVLVVHYSLFGRVGREGSRTNHVEHVRLTGWVVMVPMVVELATSAWLVVRRPPGSGLALAWAGLAAAVMTWYVTAIWSLPTHDRLARGLEAAPHGALVAPNLLRAAAWALHSGIVLIMTARALR